MRQAAYNDRSTDDDSGLDDLSELERGHSYHPDDVKGTKKKQNKKGNCITLRNTAERVARVDLAALTCTWQLPQQTAGLGTTTITTD